MWRARRFRYILAIIDRLPRDSHYIAELADDDDLADLMADDDAEPEPPSLAEFGPVVEHLAAMRDLLGVLIAIQATAPGKRPQPPPLVRRPVTAAARARQRRLDEQRDVLAAKLWPDQAG